MYYNIVFIDYLKSGYAVIFPIIFPFTIFFIKYCICAFCYYLCNWLNNNRMRRKIAISLPLYIASIVMLVFIVLPHHHHDDYICFNTSHCEKPVDADHGKSHEHDPFSGGEGCVKHLFQTEVTKNLSLNYNDNNPVGNGHHFSISLFTLAGSIDPLLFELRSNLFPDACNEFFRSVLFTSDKAGRAPPIS